MNKEALKRGSIFALAVVLVLGLIVFLPGQKVSAAGATDKGNCSACWFYGGSGILGSLNVKPVCGGCNLYPFLFNQWGTFNPCNPCKPFNPCNPCNPNWPWPGSTPQNPLKPWDWLPVFPFHRPEYKPNTSLVPGYYPNYGNYSGKPNTTVMPPVLPAKGNYVITNCPTCNQNNKQVLQPVVIYKGNPAHDSLVPGTP